MKKETVLEMQKNFPWKKHAYVTGIDRSFIRSLYQFRGFKGSNVLLRSIRYDGVWTKDIKGSQENYSLPMEAALKEYREAETHELRGYEILPSNSLDFILN